jgi:hypothetical protein
VVREEFESQCLGGVIRQAQVIEFSDFWPLDGDFLANSILRIPSKSSVGVDATLPPGF